MKLDRNISGDGRGKYGIIRARRLAEIAVPGTPDHMHNLSVQHAIKYLENAGVLDWGKTPDTEFFVMMLKDQHSGHALAAYAHDVYDTGGDAEYASDIHDLACRSGRAHPNHKRPD